MSLEAEWGRCAPWLDAALGHAGRTHALADVRRMIAAGDAQFWSGPAAAMVTLIQDEPLERRLLIWLAGGDIAELRRRLFPGVERWARGQGCRRLLVIGRAGWERELRAEGFAPVARLIAKDLQE